MEFILGELFFTYKDYKDYIDIELIPFGNSWYISGKLHCQHGKSECDANALENCVVKYVENPFLTIHCITKELYEDRTLEQAKDLCFTITGVNNTVQSKIRHCYTSSERDFLLKQAFNKTKSTFPENKWEYGFIPYIGFDDFYASNLQFYQKDLSFAICNFLSAKNLENLNNLCKS
ncbi:unnamed protein product [Bursaphelenchus xylophilus]|uniref:(pine wood nematode) hypothetical protein n=1 Tax=Bursaphelenchus xylophilus TaxID=6326 RepID=A0A1I7RTW4_BURXY|nr:unnamed protein product [Bursaphelenchus xylophilus]CAG9132141.1 unnamed protein product [Bursaphelenchus xylophilus]